MESSVFTLPMGTFSARYRVIAQESLLLHMDRVVRSYLDRGTVLHAYSKSWYVT